MSRSQQPPTLDPRAAARSAARPGPAPWLHEEVARRMAERLDWITLPVRRWAHWSPRHGGMEGHALVAARFPQAEALGVPAGEVPPPSAPPRPWWHPARWAGTGQPAHLPPMLPAPPEGSLDMVWANMLLHRVADPAALLADWHRALAINGFVMFSGLGPDTLRSLRHLYTRLGWPPPAHEFTDMHDWGDMLLAAGFAEPVMAMERLTLTFDSAERALQELRGLGRNLHRQRFHGLRTAAWRQRLLAEMDAALRPGGPGTPLALEFELIYGHALKPAARLPVTQETAIGIDTLRSHLRQRRTGPAVD
ncbi:methyltransferase domain-containing protein [Comamonadaceae bacterium OH2545_COT-014]|nr:methyltransferase domain-containing protein [Comamonadaceae bacterium OH2545_COT-014]